MTDAMRAPQGPRLLPCPFCGGRVYAVQDKHGAVTIGCDSEDCYGARALTYFSLPDAVESYNRRAAAVPEPQTESGDKSEGVPTHAGNSGPVAARRAAPPREQIVAVLGQHFMQRSCLGCSCGAVFSGRYDDDALVEWHLNHVADALRAALGTDPEEKR